MGRCRVYLFTYKRNHLLSRAVQSLINQTFTDWVCEVHNDDPADLYPAEYIRSLNDTRFVIKNHTENLGAVKSFHLAFKGCHEEYASILEDDNWWEPTFLSEMIAVMDAHPSLNIAWSNMQLWQEEAENEWKNTGKTVWPEKQDFKFFTWPAPQQAMSALHSNGAMIYRGKRANRYTVPDNTVFNAIELVRERSFEHPICLVSKPLANFAITRTTHRTADKWIWIATQLMLLASFILKSGNRHKTFKETLSYYRRQRPSPVINFLLVNAFILKDPKLLKFFNIKDWLTCLKWLGKNAYQLKTLKGHLTAQQDVFNFLLIHTANRYNEALKTTAQTP